MTRLQTCLLILLVLASTGLSQQLDRESLQGQLSEQAEQIRKYLKGREANQVAIGQISVPPNFKANPGPGLAKELEKQLTAVGVEVVDQAAFFLRGELEFSEDPVGAEIKLELANALGKKQYGFEKAVQVVDENDLISIVSPTVRLDQNKTPSERKKDVLVSTINPKANVNPQNSKLQSDPSSPYSIEVLFYPSKVDSGQDPTQLEYKPCFPTAIGGRAYVELEVGGVYAIRVTNDSTLDAAVALEIDGLNMFEFNPDGYQHMIIPAGTAHTIYGWFLSKQNSAYFEVTNFANAEANKLKKAGADIGVVTTTFRAAWEVGAKPPADEESAKFTARGDQGTKKGLEFQQQFKEVKRKTGVIRDVISVRYNKPAQG